MKRVSGINGREPKKKDKKEKEKERSKNQK